MENKQLTKGYKMENTEVKGKRGRPVGSKTEQAKAKKTSHLTEQIKKNQEAISELNKEITKRNEKINQYDSELKAL